MKNLKLLVLTALAGIGVAITYFYFEQAVHHSLDYIWNDLFDTEKQRVLVIPICLSLSLAYFGSRHLLDSKSEKKESHGLGDIPEATPQNFIKVLFIGFLSLLAGASLGPEAILVPACFLLGSYIGAKLMSEEKSTKRLLGMAGFIALFAAFFNSVYTGLLSLLLIKRQFKIDLSLRLIILAAVASASTVLTLGVLDSASYIRLPDYSWRINISTLLVLAILAIVGYASTYLLGVIHNFSKKIAEMFRKRQWWLRAVVAAAGLSLLYLLGGPLVEFTGNESVVPMLKQAADLGFIGLVWLLLIKLSAIAWSKAAGYRGGLIFPVAFSASILVAITQLYISDFNFIYGLIAAMTGFLVADSKVKVLLG